MQCFPQFLLSLNCFSCTEVRFALLAFHDADLRTSLLCCTSQCLWRTPFSFPPTLTLRSCGCAAHMVANQGAVLIAVGWSRPGSAIPGRWGSFPLFQSLEADWGETRLLQLSEATAGSQFFQEVLSNLWIFYLVLLGEWQLEICFIWWSRS